MFWLWKYVGQMWGGGIYLSEHILVIFYICCCYGHFLLRIYQLKAISYYDFCIKTTFGSSLSPVVFWRAHVLFTLFVFVR